jgi:hypothetical protein
MRRIVLLISFLAALTLSASGQTYVNFQNMPMALTPTLMPDNFPEGLNLNWDNFYYVTAGMWSGEGPGFQLEPSANPSIVAFMGGPQCALTNACFAMIKLNAPNTVWGSFSPMSIKVSAGWMPGTVKVLAYDNSRFVGSLNWELTTTAKTFTFPAAWRVTQLVFTPGVLPTNTIHPNIGSLVIHEFTLMMN